MPRGPPFIGTPVVTWMPPLAKVEKELAISIGLTSEVPRPMEGTASRLRLMPARCPTSATSVGPTRVTR